MFTRLIAITTITLLSGCASYHAPGRAADFRALGLTAEAQKAATPLDINAGFDRKPLANFPAGVAVVRIQAPGYVSPTAQGFGGGAYSVVLIRDVEPDDAFTRLAKLPQVRGVAPIGRLLLPPSSTPTASCAKPPPSSSATCSWSTPSTPPSMTATWLPR